MITDQQVAIKSALASLKLSGDWHGTHLLDNFHYLHNLLKKTKHNRPLFEDLKLAMEA